MHVNRIEAAFAAECSKIGDSGALARRTNEAQVALGVAAPPAVCVGPSSMTANAPSKHRDHMCLFKLMQTAEGREIDERVDDITSRVYEAFVRLGVAAF
jgi:hypothetical protein